MVKGGLEWLVLSPVRGIAGWGVVSCYQSLMPDGIILIEMLVLEILYGFLLIFFSYGIQSSMICLILGCKTGKKVLDIWVGWNTFRIGKRNV